MGRMAELTNGGQPNLVPNHHGHPIRYVTHGHYDRVGVDGVALALGAALRHEAGVGAQAGDGGDDGNDREPDRPEAAHAVDVVVQLVAVADRARQGEPDAENHTEKNENDDMKEKPYIFSLVCLCIILYRVAHLVADKI